MKDIETRKREYRRRRIQVMIMKTGVLIILAVIIGILAVAFSAVTSGYELDSASVITVHYSGFDGEASAEPVISYENLKDELDAAYAKYASSIWPIKKNLEQKDFEAFASSVEYSLDKTESLRNGDEINITVSYDESMADDLGLDVKFKSIPLTVENLEQGRVITKEDLFKDVTISCNGISPLIEIELVNNTQDDFLKTVNYRISSEKSYYKNGETIKVTASYDPDLAIGVHYDMQTGDNTMSYTVDEPVEYVQSISQIDEETFKAAFEKGKDCFVDANEYGLRIFTEAGLRYTWVGTGDYTFEWSNPRLISSYVETLKDPELLASGKVYNYLEIVYEIHIEQANGTGCDAEAVVCFNEMTIDENGKVDFNPDSGQLFSASYLDKNIKSSLRGWFGDDYTLEKFDLSTMNIE